MHTEPVVDDDEWAICGECEDILCIDCAENACDYCMDAKNDVETHGASMCQECMTECAECQDAFHNGKTDKQLSFHNCCLAKHHRECNAKSRQERTLACLEETVKNKRVQLENVKHRIASLQSETLSLETEIASAEQQRTALLDNEHRAEDMCLIDD